MDPNNPQEAENMPGPGSPCSAWLGRDELRIVDEGLRLIGRYDLRGMEEWLARQGLGSPESMEPPAWERMVLSITAECRRLLRGAAP